MDIEFQHRGTLFVWHYAKAWDNERRHGVEFFEAVAWRAAAAEEAIYDQ